jgi:anaerobic C4-dicarboxylate transporter
VGAALQPGRYRTRSHAPRAFSRHLATVAHRNVPCGERLFLIPNYGTIIAAINFDRSGTTRIGKYVINHSFLVPGLVSTTIAVAVGLLIGSMMGLETPH